MTTRFNGFTLRELEELENALDTSIVNQTFENEEAISVLFGELKQEIKNRK